MVAQWYNLRFEPETRETQVRTLPWASSGHVTIRSMSRVSAIPTLPGPDDNLRYKEVLYWRKLEWTKGGESFLLLSAQF